MVNTEEDAVYIEPLLNDSYIDEKKLKGNGRPHLVYRQSQLPKLDKQINPLDIRNIGNKHWMRLKILCQKNGAHVCFFLS